MGKPYVSELSKLAETYEWAISQDITALTNAINVTNSLPMLAVGSGGSLSAAEVMISCHERAAHFLGRAVTPLELLTALPNNQDTSVWFFSAGGGNVDIRRAYKHALLKEPRQVAALVGKLNSKLSTISGDHHYTDLIEVELPAGHDGFLATNSLLAFTVLICRAYDKLNNCSEITYNSLNDLMTTALPAGFNLSQLSNLSENLWKKTAIHVLYSSPLKSAAVDIESKFIEAGLYSVHLADFRNFAHGRHHWLAKHEESSAVLALSVPSDAELAQKTLSLLPDQIPQLHIPLQCTGTNALISGIVMSLYLAGAAGKSRGIDPGRPGVPDFGSKLYNLGANTGFCKTVKQIDIAIQRKVGSSVSSLTPHRRTLWEQAYQHFRTKLIKARFKGVVMDYDGTVVDTRHRFNPPTPEVTEEIVRLLQYGILIGFATGRGKSIREDLRKVIPTCYWDRVIVGYYNGAEIAHLTQDETPDCESPPCADLEIIFKSIQNHIEIKSLAKITCRKFQLTVEPTTTVPENKLWELAQNEIKGVHLPAPAIYRSSHSIDILAQGVSKLSVINALLAKFDSSGDVLAIGDRGKWPGNDSLLLKHVHSLSVDEVSPSPETCWNICPAGVRGVQGTLYCLQQLEVDEVSAGVARFSKSGIKL
ncbi:MAG: HAD hydrolase family protein [Desulfuromonadaceae bacterium]|nr:HAD hydrolase family protein [Desulfuromonadaceae bacterium]